MAAFTNTFSWSASRDRLFRTCPRAYYYNYYAYWNGWSYNADEKTKTIYKLKKLQGLPLWAGSTVHDVIQVFLELQQAISGIPGALDKVNPTKFLSQFQATYERETASYKKTEDLEEVAKEKSAINEAIAFAYDGLMLQQNPLLLKAMARVKLREGFKASMGQQKKFNNKALYLFEHYYQEPVTGEKFGEVATKIYTALANFCSSKDITNMLLTPADQWRSVDELTKYNLTNLLDQPDDKTTYFYKDIPIWCAIDFAYTDAKGDLWIVDWKTGKENSEELKIQLASYAIFAQQEWQIPLEKIHLCGVFLNNGGDLKEYKLTVDEINMARQSMATSARKMLIELDNQADNETSESHYPCDPDDFKCRFCNFKGICNKEPILPKKEVKPASDLVEIVVSEAEISTPPPAIEESSITEEVRTVGKPVAFKVESVEEMVVKESEPTQSFDFFSQKDAAKPASDLPKIVVFEAEISTPPPAIEVKVVKPKKKTRYQKKILENKVIKSELVQVKKEVRALTASNKRQAEVVEKSKARVTLVENKSKEIKKEAQVLKSNLSKKDRKIVAFLNSNQKLKEQNKTNRKLLKSEISLLRREIRDDNKLIQKTNDKLEKQKKLLDNSQSEKSELQKKLKLKTKDMVYQPSLFEQDYSNYGSGKK